MPPFLESELLANQRGQERRGHSLGLIKQRAHELFNLLHLEHVIGHLQHPLVRYREHPLPEKQDVQLQVHVQQHGCPLGHNNPLEF